jgi:hypothetical protein
MHLKLPHKFTKTEATARVKKMLDDARQQIAGKAEIEKEEWTGDTLNFAFSAQGQHIEGTLSVEDHDYIIDAKLPLMLRIFEGKIEKMIGEQSAQMLK